MLPASVNCRHQKPAPPCVPPKPRRARPSKRKPRRSWCSIILRPVPASREMQMPQRRPSLNRRRHPSAVRSIPIHNPKRPWPAGKWRSGGRPICPRVPRRRRCAQIPANPGIRSAMPRRRSVRGLLTTSSKRRSRFPPISFEFPREIIAPRRMRPRIAEANPIPEDAQQLSIFEVDPDTVSTEPMASAASSADGPAWIGSSWQQIELDAQPQPLPEYYAIPADDAPKLYQAPFGRRHDGHHGGRCADPRPHLRPGLALSLPGYDQLPGKRVSEVLGTITVLGFAALYEWFFLTSPRLTPGMRYAGIALCTFDERRPTAEQIKRRLEGHAHLAPARGAWHAMVDLRRGPPELARPPLADIPAPSAENSGFAADCSRSLCKGAQCADAGPDQGRIIVVRKQSQANSSAAGSSSPSFPDGRAAAADRGSPTLCPVK